LTNNQPKPIPLDTLIDKDVNVYEMTCVAIKQAAAITRNGDQELENERNKVVSLVLTQVLNDEVEYTKPSSN